MIQDFADFCLWAYVVIDDIWREVGQVMRRPGPEPVCSDSELITMTLVGECCGWAMETELLSRWQAYSDLFPHVPTQSRYNRRRRNLMQGFNLIRNVLLGALDLAQDRQCVIDSLPIPVVQFHLVPSAKGDWPAHGAAFGKVPSKKQTIYGYKLHLLITLAGVILDFELAPANAADLTVGVELLSQHTDLTVLGDKAYISAAQAAALWHGQRIRLLTMPRSNQKTQLPNSIQQRFNAMRQIIETVNAQLTAQFTIEINHAHSFWGLCTRLHTKLSAHTLCIYLNRISGCQDFLQIKSLAFPI